MNIGIYGGAFDPPHLAHVALAKVAISQFNLDQLLVIPTGDAVHKRRHLSAAAHRVAMTQLAFADLPKVKIDEREIRRGGASYTIDTLTELAEEFPQAKLTLIIGQDQLTAFHTWLHHTEILKRAKLVVAMRHGGTVMIPPETGFEPIDFEPQAVSSSDIRQAVRMKEASFAAKMNPQVAAYVEQHELYLH
jgi:nicotinate-nucleotide adenylyltransferase